MNTNGSQIVKSFRNLREFHSSVAKMLQTATNLMGEKNFLVPSRASACGSSTSKAIYASLFWMPEDAFQFYRIESNPTLLAYVAVLFDDVRQPETVKEPLATVGWIQFSASSPATKGDYQYQWCRLCLSVDEYDSKFEEWADVNSMAIDAKGYYEVDIARTMSCALLSIKNEDDVDKKLSLIHI